MVSLETKSIEIQNRMHDSVTHDFDKVSDFNDNGLTPLQGQQDEWPEGVNSAENSIDNDVVDIMTLYPPWSTCTIPVPVIVLCLSAIFVHNINSSELHFQSVALRSQYSDHTPEAVTLH